MSAFSLDLSLAARFFPCEKHAWSWAWSRRDFSLNPVPNPRPKLKPKPTPNGSLALRQRFSLPQVYRLKSVELAMQHAALLPLHCLSECQCPWSCRLCSNLNPNLSPNGSLLLVLLRPTSPWLDSKRIQWAVWVPCCDKTPLFLESKQNLEISMKIISLF